VPEKLALPPDQLQGSKPRTSGKALRCGLPPDEGERASGTLVASRISRMDFELKMARVGTSLARRQYGSKAGDHFRRHAATRT
jgi:hypothetical protein